MRGQRITLSSVRQTVFCSLYKSCFLPHSEQLLRSRGDRSLSQTSFAQGLKEVVEVLLVAVPVLKNSCGSPEPGGADKGISIALLPPPSRRRASTWLQWHQCYGPGLTKANWDDSGH